MTAPALLDLYEKECRPIAEANARDSFENMKNPALISRAIGPFTDRASLEARLAALTEAERTGLDAAVEAQRSHFASHVHLPRDPSMLNA